MRFAKCSALLVSLFLTGCSKSSTEAQPNNGKEITELKRRNEVLASRVRQLEEQNASIESARVLLEKERQARVVEIAKLTAATEESQQKVQELLRGQLETNKQKLQDLENERSNAISSFARLGQIEKAQALDALSKARKFGADKLDRQEIELLGSVSTKETRQMVMEWEVAEAKKYGFDENGGTIAGPKPRAIEDTTATKPVVRTSENPKLIAAKRKAMKDIQAKGLAIKRQLANMEGNETPAVLKKIPDLEKQFDVLKSDYDKLAAEVDELERESKAE